MTVDSLSQILARWAAELSYEDLPVEVIHHVKRSLLDYFGVTLRGSTSIFARKLRHYLVSNEGAGEASVLGTSHRLSPANAALANGTAATILELDQGHARAPIHLAAVLLPAILSTAQARSLPAREVIIATAVAYEISSRLAIAAHRLDVQGLNLTSLLGVLGAAIGGARLIGRDASTIANTFGIAGSNAGGLFDYHGGWLDTWCLNSGRSAREGVLCAGLAELGFAGPVDVFDGQRGLMVLFHDRRFDRDVVLSGLGQNWLMRETYIKLYPCCRILHPVIDGVISLRTQLEAKIERIERIIVDTSEDSARLDGTTFDTEAEAQMSIPYGVAAAFVFGPPRLEHFEEAVRRDSRIRRVVDRVEVRKSDDPTIADRRLTARVTFVTTDSTTGVTIEEPSGNPNNPVSDETLEAKFRHLVEPVLGRDSMERMAEAVWRLDTDAEALRSIEQLIQTRQP